MSILHLAKSEVNKYRYHILNNTWVFERFHFGYLVVTLLLLVLPLDVYACTHICIFGKVCFDLPSKVSNLFLLLCFLHRISLWIDFPFLLLKFIPGKFFQ